MAFKVLPYTKDYENSVKDFNIRLSEGGSAHNFPETCVSEGLPKKENRRIYEELFLLTESNHNVRGAYILKTQDFFFGNETRSIVFYHSPVSEGLVNRNYNYVGFNLLHDALKKHPLLFALGMGSYNKPLPKMLKGLGWKMCSVPFYFKVLNPVNFLRNVTFIRARLLGKILLDLSAFTGLGWLFIKIVQFRKKKAALTCEKIDKFTKWADDLWEECKERYKLVAVRDSKTLNVLYSLIDNQFISLKVSYENETIGWVIVLVTQMSAHKYFGNMKVGSIVDCLSLPENTGSIITCATEFFKKKCVDLVVSNQLHKAWCAALKQSGFNKGPSNFIFAVSKKLSKTLEPFELNKENFHLNRGDGEGPINL